MGIFFSSLPPSSAPDSSSTLSTSPYCLGSTNTDSQSVGFSASTMTAGKCQFDGEGSVPLPIPSPNVQILDSPNLKVFSFDELKSATNNFSLLTSLGEGSFGRAYPGWLDKKTLTPRRPGSGMVVAIKKINPDGFQGLFREWQFEVNLLGRLSHPNLIKLFGYCWDDEELLLVYEFLSRGSLADYIFRRGAFIRPLFWTNLIKVAIGAARGLAFLHTSGKQVVYSNFNASKILLDWNFNAKISYFGFATWKLPGEGSHETTKVMGTFGYLAPEFITTGQLQMKSDVYGFGVVLLQMLTCMKAMDAKRPIGQHVLIDWVKPLLSDKIELKAVMNAKIKEQYLQEATFQAAQLCLKCIEPDPEQRPSMKDVLEALEAIEAIQVRSK